MNYIGEVVTANNGQRMTLIAYRQYKDIDVQFEDGTIVTNKSYHHFKYGTIANPNCKISSNKICPKYKLGDILYDITGLPCKLVDISRRKFTVEHNGKIRTFSRTNMFSFHFYSSRYTASLKVGSCVTSKDGYKATIKDYISNCFLLHFEDDDSEFLESTSNVNSGNFFKNTVYGRVGQKYKREDNSYWTVIEVINKDLYKVSSVDGVELVTRKELKTGRKEEKTTIEYRYEYNGSYFKDLPSLLRSLNRIDEVEKIRAILKRYPHLSIYEVLDRSKEVSRGKKSKLQWGRV